MLKSRWLSTFTVIGAVLIALGIAGLFLGPRFVYDPGQPVTGKEAWCYLVIGALMVLNGFLTPNPVDKTPPKAVRRKPGHLGIQNPVPQAEERPATISAAEKTEETRTV